MSWRVGELASWRAGELASWRVGELVSWRTGELASFFLLPNAYCLLPNFPIFAAGSWF